jgi:hypothetical protein
MLDTDIGYVKPEHMQRLFREAGSLANQIHRAGRTVWSDCLVGPSGRESGTCLRPAVRNRGCVAVKVLVIVKVLVTVKVLVIVKVTRVRLRCASFCTLKLRG